MVIIKANTPLNIVFDLSFQLFNVGTLALRVLHKARVRNNFGTVAATSTIIIIKYDFTKSHVILLGVVSSFEQPEAFRRSRQN